MSKSKAYRISKLINRESKAIEQCNKLWSDHADEHTGLIHPDYWNEYVHMRVGISVRAKLIHDLGGSLDGLPSIVTAS